MIFSAPAHREVVLVSQIGPVSSSDAAKQALSNQEYSPVRNSASMLISSFTIKSNTKARPLTEKKEELFHSTRR